MVRFFRSVTAVCAALTLGAGTAVLAPTAASAAAPLPTLTVTMSANGISTSSGTTVHAGRVMIRVVSTGGEHDLQLAKLARGYSLAQASKDFAGLFGPGNVPAVRRVDRNVHFLGGASVTPGHPALFAETLYAGTYQLIDTNGPAHSVLNVVGTPPRRGWVAQSSTIIGNRQDRFQSPATLPHTGWTLFRDTSDEPHFIVLQQVKPGTTAKQIGDFLASGSNGAPPFALAGSASSGIVSGGTQMLWHYALPAGRYAMLCFWPDDATGMPHANMGMYKLVTLR